MRSRIRRPTSRACSSASRPRSTSSCASSSATSIHSASDASGFFRSWATAPANDSSWLRRSCSAVMSEMTTMCSRPALSDRGRAARAYTRCCRSPVVIRSSVRTGPSLGAANSSRNEAATSSAISRSASGRLKLAPGAPIPGPRSVRAAGLDMTMRPTASTSRTPSSIDSMTLCSSAFCAASASAAAALPTMTRAVASRRTMMTKARTIETASSSSMTSWAGSQSSLER
jgi:hypothetical protein